MKGEAWREGSVHGSPSRGVMSHDDLPGSVGSGAAGGLQLGARAAHSARRAGRGIVGSGRVARSGDAGAADGLRRDCALRRCERARGAQGAIRARRHGVARGRVGDARHARDCGHAGERRRVPGLADGARARALARQRAGRVVRGVAAGAADAAGRRVERDGVRVGGARAAHKVGHGRAGAGDEGARRCARGAAGRADRVGVACGRVGGARDARRDHDTRLRDGVPAEAERARARRLAEQCADSVVGAHGAGRAVRLAGRGRKGVGRA